MNMSYRKNFNLNNIKLDFSKELNEGIDVVALDIQKGIEKGSQFGRAFKRNAEITKLKKGFDHPLKETGLMMDAGKMQKTKATTSKQVAALAPNNSRVDIAYNNHNGTDRIPAREFWGISEKAENEIMVRVKARINQEIRSA